MKTVLADLFARLVARIGSADFPALALGAQSPPELTTTLGAVVGSAVIEGIEGGKREPHALFVIAAPNLAPDSSNLLTFAARRAQAQRAPYFVVWTLRDAVLWRTPKPGAAIAAAQLEKLRDYEDNYDISPNAGAEIFNEPRRRELLARGEDLLRDLTRLYQNQALELVQVEATYFVERLLQSVHTLLPLLTSSLLEQLEINLDLRVKVQAWAIVQGSLADTPTRLFAGASRDRRSTACSARFFFTRAFAAPRGSFPSSTSMGSKPRRCCLHSAAPSARH